MNSKLKHPYIEILDTTLRDGEQTPGVSFSPQEKLEIARLLLSRVKVDRLELASAGVSEGEAHAVREIIHWAEPHGFLHQLEILGFIDNGKSVAWINDVGGKRVNLVAKGSVDHCKLQLRKTPARHLDDVVKEINRAAVCCNHKSGSHGSILLGCKPLCRLFLRNKSVPVVDSILHERILVEYVIVGAVKSNATVKSERCTRVYGKEGA